VGSVARAAASNGGSGALVTAGECDCAVALSLKPTKASAITRTLLVRKASPTALVESASRKTFCQSKEQFFFLPRTYRSGGLQFRK